MRKMARSACALMLPLVAIACAPAARQPAASPASGVVHVAPPTGERETDRASILAALEQVEPGGTVQFSAGTYLVGEIIPIATPRLTLLGDPAGTTLRACEVEDFAAVGDAMIAMWTGDADPRDPSHIAKVRACDLLQLTGGHATVRNLTFEHAWTGLTLGCCQLDERGVQRTEGGYLIEDNTFRDIINGVRGILSAPDPSVIRGNRFINTYHAVAAHGSHLHVLDNQVSVPDPARVSSIAHPGSAISLAGGTMVDLTGQTAVPCDGNVIAGNWIEGHPDGILIISTPGATCRRNAIRDNTIVVATPSFDPDSPVGRSFDAVDGASSIITGVPLGLYTVDDPRENANGVEETVIEGNTVTGAIGVGIELVRASGNRVANNTVTGIRIREPFPGHIVGFPPAWAEANGAGIWISPGSDGNEIVGNTFTDIAAHAVVLEGDSNVVETRGKTDGVRDLGTGNRVRQPAGPDTARHTAMPGGIPRGERLVWPEGPNTLRYAMLFGPPGAPNRPRLESTVEMNAEGMPTRIEVWGFQPHGTPSEEHDELGSIEPGKLADLILVDGDPTADIRDIRRVMMVVKDGRAYDTAALYGALGIRPCCHE